MTVETVDPNPHKECSCACCKRWTKWSNEVFKEIADVARQSKFDHEDAMDKILNTLGEA